MFKCYNCGATFDSPETQPDFVSEYWGQRVTHYISVCPHCSSDEFDEMDKCDICGEYIDPGEDICEECRDLIKDLAYEIRGKVREKTIIHKLNYNEFISHLIEELDR